MDSAPANPLKAARLKAKLRRVHVAAALNVSTQTIYNWELGLTCPDIGRAQDIADAFRMKVADVIAFIASARRLQLMDRGAH